jgi:C-3',4' desaturase CrtD
MKRVVIIGAGIGGLTSAAVLARYGFDVHVLEAHVYPGGCAGTFYHQGHRFDAGATLAGGFYSGGPMDQVAKAVDITDWPARPAEPAMVVHLPDGSQVTRWSDDRRLVEHASAFGQDGVNFFRWQETTADALWALALRNPSWPPQSPRQVVELLNKGITWLGEDIHRLRPGLLADLFRPVNTHLNGKNENLRLFVDAQLLISAQCVSSHANALYGASALDLPRRGVVHLSGGMGAIARTLSDAVIKNGGRVTYRKKVSRIVYEKGQPVGVELKRGESLSADIILANLPPWNINRLLGEFAPPRLADLPPQPSSGWGAFMLYVGLDGQVVPSGFPLHHQLILREPFGEGNTIFLSLSPEWDHTRAPKGQRALTISTHTDFRTWWELFQNDSPSYAARKQIFTHNILEAAERVFPGIRQGAKLVLPGTPLSFERFTERAWGWVGGFPQTNLFKSWGPRLAKNLWMVGDSIFPGQSTAAVALGGLRVAQDILHSV